jgi:hypothetical protein
MLKVERDAVATPAGGAEPAVGNDDPLISAPTRARRASKRTVVIGQMQLIPLRPELHNTVLQESMQLLQ